MVSFDREGDEEKVLYKWGMIVEANIGSHGNEGSERTKGTS